MLYIEAITLANKTVYLNTQNIVRIEKDDRTENITNIFTADKEMHMIEKSLEEVLKMLDSSESIV